MRPLLTFGEALKEMQNGERVSRIGWNGADMWVCILNFKEEYSNNWGNFLLLPCFGLKNAQGDMQPGWVASQADMLAYDWEIVE